MKAFITLLSSEDYLDAVLVLNRSFKGVNSKYPLICGLTEDLKSNTSITRPLAREGIKVEVIKRLTYHHGVSDNWPGHPVLNTASKISLFDLKWYDKLVYIDADTIVLENIDDVMNYPDGAMIEPSSDRPVDDYGFTGLFVFQPKYHREDFYKCLLQNFPCADGDLLGNLWFFTRTSKYHRIPYEYCMHYGYYLYNSEGAKVVHFCNEQKPWKTEWKNYFDGGSNTCIQTYRKYLNQVQNSKKNSDKNPSYCSALNFIH